MRLTIKHERHYSIDVAMVVGIIPSIVLTKIASWYCYNAANKTNFKDGEYWSYNSVRAWSEELPELSKDQIRRAIDKLKQEGYLKTANYNKSGYDKTIWYTLTDKAKTLLFDAESVCENSQIDLANLPNEFGSDAKPIPIITQSITQNDIIEEPEKEKPKKKAKPKFIPPTLEEVKAYCEKRHNNVDPQRFIDYYEAGDWHNSQGKPLLNWKQTIISVWEKKAEENYTTNNKPYVPEPPIYEDLTEKCKDYTDPWYERYDKERRENGY